MNCPKCTLTNPATALKCDCGYDFSTGVGGGRQKGELSFGYWIGPAALIAPFIITIPLLRRGIGVALVAPAACGLACIVCGFVTLVRGHRVAGIAQIIIGVICGGAGTMLALMAGVGLDH